MKIFYFKLPSFSENLLILNQLKETSEKLKKSRKHQSNFYEKFKKDQPSGNENDSRRY